MEVEEDIDLKEDDLIAVNEEPDIRIKQEEIPEDIIFPDIKSEPHEVSYVCMSVIRYYQCPALSVVFVMSVFLAN
jgi:hypothetical protein